MPTRTLPPRPDLAQLKRQAHELHKLQRERKASAAARIVANHPEFRNRSPQDVLAGPIALADAPLVVAREDGFPSGAALQDAVECGTRRAAIIANTHLAE